MTPTIIREPIRSKRVWYLIETAFEPFLETTGGVRQPKPPFKTLIEILLRCVRALSITEQIQQDLDFLWGIDI
jgi:hypothetical protein